MRTYKTGFRIWSQFLLQYPAISAYPLPRAAPQEFELSLAFFDAHLALQPSISRGTTVASYLTHVRHQWRRAGCPSRYLTSEFVALVTRGIHRALPAYPDSRQALLLLACRPPNDFLYPSSALLFRLKLATILGFFGMLRISAITQLKPASIILVSASGRQTLLSRIPVSDAHGLCRRFIGFFFRFRGKSTPVGAPPQAAYFAKISDIAPSFRTFCPLHLLMLMLARGCFTRPNRRVFPASFSASILCPYLMYVARRGQGQLPVDVALIKSHSLRIGGHTYFTAMGMQPDLTDFLGRRKVPRASLRYFRSHPALTLNAIRRFFHQTPPPDYL